MPRRIVLGLIVASVAIGAFLAFAGARRARTVDGSGRGGGDAGGQAPSPGPAPPGLAAGAGLPAPTPAETVATAPASTGPSTLVAHVSTRGDAEAPIPGAEVLVIDAAEWKRIGSLEATRVRGTTDADGAARFVLPRSGAYVVLASAEGRHPRRENVDANPERETSVEFHLWEGVGFDGRVVAAADGRPIAGATVRYALTGPGEIGSPSPRSPDGILVTREDGRFRVPGVSPLSRIRLLADAPGFHHSVADGYDVPPGGLVLRLEPGGRIGGTVRDRDGHAVAGARVHLEPHDRLSSSSEDEFDVTTRDDGTYVVVGTPLGVAHRVRAEREGYGSSEAVEPVASTVEAPEARADLVLRRPATIVVRVVDDQGRPPEETWVSYDGAGERVDARGIHRFEGLSPGSFTVRASSPLYHEASERVDVAEGQVVDVRLKLDPGVRVEGLVLDPDGVPLADAQVSVESVDGDTRESGPSDAKGRFRVGGLEPGEYVLSARAGDDLAPPVRVQAPSKDVRLRIERRGKVRFRILLPDGSAHARPFDVSVEHSQGGGRPFGVDEFAEDGSTTLDDLYAGPVRITVYADGFPPLEIGGELRAGESKDLGDHTLAAGVAFAGLVRDTAGRPVPGARVEAGQVLATTGEDGRFALAHAVPGEGELGVLADGFFPVTRAVRIAAGGPIVEVVLVRYATLYGLLKDARGKPLRGIRLKADWGGAAYTRESGLDGRVAFRLQPGRWRITARTEDGSWAAIGEWTLAEGEEREVDLFLPAR